MPSLHSRNIRQQLQSMLRSDQQKSNSSYQNTVEGNQPRKRIKLDITNLEAYNEFYGEPLGIINQDLNDDVQEATIVKQQNQNCDIQVQKYKYEKIFKEIHANPYIHKKLKISSLKNDEKPIKEIKNDKVQIEKKAQIKIENKKQKKNKGIQQSNWESFKKQCSGKNNSRVNPAKANYQFVAMDCQFVKAEDKQCLARISLVNEHGDTLYDSYVRPKEKITDYLSTISGITYKHIKNAPSQDNVIIEAKKHLLNKILIGHTIHKDLAVCNLTNWKGFKAIIDIAQSKSYLEQGKRISLKVLSYKFLGYKIQQGSHSSVEDAFATMKLFLKHKVNIMKQNKLIKK